MQLRDLPEDVLVCVLKESLYADSPENAFALNLPLAAVCRPWRRLALPMVYSCAFVRYDEVACLPGSPADSPQPAAGCLEAAATVVSNVGLAASVGCVGLVKNLYFDVVCVSEHLNAAKRIAELMRAGASKWPGIRSLSVMSFLSAEVADGHSVDIADYTEELHEACCSLTALLPGIRRLWFDHDNHVVLLGALGGQLASHYGMQLEELQCHCPIPLPHNGRFTQLRNAHINLSDQNGSRLPFIDPTMLERLTLSDAPPTHSWAAFNCNSDSWAIDFPTLQHLHLEYGDVDEESDMFEERHGWQLHFPQLHTMNLFCLSERCPLLRRLVLPPQMGEICIYGKGSLYQSLAQTTLPVAGRLILQIARYSNSDADVFASINRILLGAHRCNETVLRVSDTSLPVLPESIAFTGLTALWIAARTDIDTVLGFIKKLPRLTSLTFEQCTLSDDRPDMPLPAPVEHVPIRPFDTMIQRLTIGLCWGTRSPDRAPQMVKYLLLHIPSLVRLAVTSVPKHAIDTFVGEYVQTYPHLAKVNLAFTVSE